MKLRVHLPAAAAGALVVTLIATVTVAGLVGAWARAARTLLPSPFGPLWFHVLVAVVAVGCAAVAWLSLPTPGAPMGLALVLAGWSIPFWSAWAALPEPLRAACLAAPPLVVLGSTVCVLAWRPPLTGRGRRVLLAVTVPVLVGVALHVVGYDPFADPQCRLLCADLTPALDHLVTTRQTLVAVGALTLVSALTAVPAMVMARAVPRSVRLAAVLSLIPPVAVTARPGLPGSVSAAGILVLAAALAESSFRSWRVRSALLRLVDSLTSPEVPADSNPPATDAVQFAVEGAWVDDRGRDAAAEGVSWLVLTDEAGAPSMRLAVARPGDRDALMSALTPASRLALTNARLAAVVHARVREVAASRRRIVTASDSERQRIERDLHDGAQQQLVSIALHLRAVRNRLAVEPAGDLAGELDAAEDSVRVALAGLRRLAHGIFPAALADEGLAAALEDAASGSHAVVDLDVDLATEPDLGAAMAAYAATVLALDLAGTDTTVQIRVGRRGARLQVDWTAVPAPSPPADVLEAVQDRVGALGGTLIVRSSAGDVLECEAVIPCG